MKKFSTSTKVREKILPLLENKSTENIKRCEKYLQERVEKDEKLNFLCEIKIPENLPSLGAPTLNPELSIVAQSSNKTDRYLSKLQDQLRRVIGSLAEPLLCWRVNK